jgi:hypothetical protein
LLVVLFGESHLASNHLPAQLRLRRPQDRLLTVLQNIDQLYWRAAGERRERVEAVRVREDVMCVFNSTPLEKYDSYRLCIERWQHDTPHQPDPAPAFYNLVDGLLHFLNIDKYSATNGTQPRFLVDRMPEICFRPSGQKIRRMLQRKAVPEGEASAIVRALKEHGCCFVPALRAVLIDNFQLAHGAEAAARCVHHICRHEPDAAALSSSEDSFYRAVLESALGDFGARALCPARRPVRESDLSGQYALSRRSAEELRAGPYRSFIHLLDLLTLHRHYEANLRRYRERPAQLAGLLSLGPDHFLYATQWLGHLLGNQLYDAYLTGRVAKRFLRALFCRSLDKPGAARTTYFALQRKLRRGRPARLPLAKAA